MPPIRNQLTAVDPGVGVGVRIGSTCIGVGVAVDSWVGVGIAVGEGAGVGVAMGIGVDVGMEAGVSVGIGVDVGTACFQLTEQGQG